VVGWEGLYEVSSAGRVRRLPRTVLAQCGRTFGYGYRDMRATLTGGYRKVRLSANNSTMLKPVHQMVAEAFIGPPS